MSLMCLVPKGVSVFPIGVGHDYDRNELVILDHNQNNTLVLNSMDQLRMLLSLDRGYTERICRGAHTHTSNDSCTYFIVV